ncbi:MAG: hypothetical protein R3B68_06450 [Phycisphaerales bacterium]
MIDQNRQPLSRDDRDELASMAAAAARRARPAHLVGAAAVLLVGALAMAGSALLSRQSAERALNRATAENVRAVALIDEIKRITQERQDARGQGGAAGENDPAPTFLTQVIAAGTEANLTVGAPQESSSTVGGMTRRNYQYSLTAPTTEALMNWIDKVRARIPGTHVTSVSLTPQPASRSWAATITFSRLERPSN